MPVMQTGSRSEKSKFWEQHVDDWEKSSLSQKSYCQLHELPLQSFGYWKRKRKQVPADQPCFFPLTISNERLPETSNGGSTLSLLLSDGRFRIEVNDGFSTTQLSKLVVALEQL